jgi:hypothetical protein
MILYHGSNQVVDVIDFKKCRPYKDFGLGFYLTIYKEQAKRMAIRTASIYGGNPVVTIFDYNEEAASGLIIKIFDGPTAEWAQFVMNNRNRFFKDIASANCNADSKYDIVVGPVANDDIVTLFREFETGIRSFDFLAESLKHPRQLTSQYSFHTKRAAHTLTHRGVSSE